MKIQDLKIRDLKQYKLNSKRHPQAQIEGIAESIRRFGFTQPIVVDKNNEIIIGHGRLAAAQLAGLTEVPCLKLEDLKEQEVKALRLIDNRISETGWDNELLLEDLATIDYNLSDFNIDFQFLYSNDDLKFDKDEEWGDTLEYDVGDTAYRKVTVNFENEQDLAMFFKIIDQEFTDKTKSIWFPKKERNNIKELSEK